ncbi:MAG TPA: geranylgeranyl reductase family protein [Nitrolancea sp.]
MTSWDAEVLVAGGGPAGSATAALLAQRGHDVLLLERARFPREKPCAEYFSPGVVDVLERLGALDDLLAAQPARPRGMRVGSARASFLISYDAAGDRGGRAGIGIPRPLFDQVLLDHARTSGARVQEGVRVRGATVESGRVVGLSVSAQGRESELGARFVVAADGLHSTIARSLGLDLPVRRPRRLGLVARYEGVSAIGRYGEMHVGRDLYCGLAPVGGEVVNVGLVGALGVKRAGEPTERYFERRLTELPGVGKALEGARRITPIRGVGPLARRVSRVAGPGYLLVGDAAGFLDPFTGEGVYRALRGAELAADAVERALRHADAIPDGYEETRHIAFADKERVCLLIQFFLGSPRLFEYVVRRLSDRPQVAGPLAGVLGDYQPAKPALRPRFLWTLLKP